MLFKVGTVNIMLEQRYVHMFHCSRFLFPRYFYMLFESPLSQQGSVAEI